MSTPDPFATTDEHWQCIIDFVTKKADEDGITEDLHKIDLMRRYWKLLIDEPLLRKECELMELERLKRVDAAQTTIAAERAQQIADLEASTSGDRSTEPAPTPEEEPPEEVITEEERLAAIRAAEREGGTT